jgi:FKBP-type peptidyl-prolyl cis-trans isomerase 2
MAVRINLQPPAEQPVGTQVNAGHRLQISGQVDISDFTNGTAVTDGNHRVTYDIFT